MRGGLQRLAVDLRQYVATGVALFSARPNDEARVATRADGGIDLPFLDHRCFPDCFISLLPRKMLQGRLAQEYGGASCYLFLLERLFPRVQEAL